MIQDDIDEIEFAIRNGDEAGNLLSSPYYLEALAKTQLLLLCEIANKFSELK